MTTVRQADAVIAVDPGGVHVGVALWNKHNHEVLAMEIAAGHAVYQIDNLLTKQAIEYGVVHLVIEEFRLYPGSAKSLSWSPMKTSEMIGALKWVARGKGVLVIEQGANIKDPTRRQLKARGKTIRRSGDGPNTGDHANDAALHCWHYVLKNELED